MSGLTPLYRPAIPQAQRSIAFGSITNAYQKVGAVFNEGIIWLAFISSLDTPVTVSLDGTTDFLTIKALANVVIDIKTNQAAFPGWMGVYVKYVSAPSQGTFYVSAIGIE